MRVRGVTYTSPDEAYVAAAELEHHAETVASNLRRDGKDAEAEKVSDRANADAAKLREWARGREAAEASATPQPTDAPKPRRRSSAPKARGATRRRGSSRPRLTPSTRRYASQTGITGATSSATSLLLQVVGLTLGVAFLTLLLTPRGVGAFAGLTSGLSGGLRWIIDPVDPLAPRPKPAAASYTPASSSARRTLTVVPLAVGVG